VTARADVVKTLIIAAAIGLLIGAGLLVLLDLFDDRPTSITDLLEVFDEPVLSQIPLENPRRRGAELDLITLSDERHAFAEAYRTLRSSLLYMAAQQNRPTGILVTSAVPGDGKSLSAANLAITLAQPGSRVLLIDADLRKGLLHQRFSLPPTPGLNEVLSAQTSWAEAVQSTFIPNLFLLPRGNTARNPGEMFLQNDTGRLLKEMKGRYDYVVLDSAPVMAADDVTSLAPHVDGVIFVIRAGRTSARVARAALDLLYQRNVNLLGLLFNGVEPGSTEYYYYYKYKDYYSKYYPNA
jgi:capsular exopolysaccharide synthesis family protein